MTNQTPIQVLHSVSKTAQLKLYSLMLHPENETAAEMNIRRWMNTGQIDEFDAEWLRERVKEMRKCDCD